MLNNCLFAFDHLYLEYKKNTRLEAADINNNKFLHENIYVKNKNIYLKVFNLSTIFVNGLFLKGPGDPPGEFSRDSAASALATIKSCSLSIL